MCKNFFRTFVASLLICSMLVVPGFAEDAIVSGSDVNVRSGPGVNYPVVACLPRNAAITVTDRSNGDWYAISYNGVSGFMSSRYIDIVDNEGDYEITFDEESTDSGSTGYINAMYVRFRSGPNSSSSILGEYNAGKKVQILGSSGGWTQCVINGKNGYVYSDYISSEYSGNGSDENSSGSASSDGIIIIGPGYETQPEQEPVVTPKPEDSQAPVIVPTPTATPEPDSNSGVIIAPETTPEPVVTPTPTVPPVVDSTEEKSGSINAMYVRFRSGPGTSYSILGTYNRGQELTIKGTSGEWTKCVIDGQEGFVYTSYVSLNTQSEPVPDSGSNDSGDDSVVETPVQPTPSAPPVVNNTTAKPGFINGNNVRFRSAPSTSSSIISELYYGNNVTITGTSGDWTAVTYNGESGFVYSTYVKEGEYSYSSSGGTATGREIADFALKYVGYNYCWGGKDPSTGFDCSGLMYYVYSQFGYTLNRVASDQARNGVHVDPSDLQPGDLLCFYSSGSYIGHVGMYIGDNQFVHASTSTTGVIISELSGYYTTRGYEARRII